MRTDRKKLDEMLAGILAGTVTHVIANNTFREMKENTVYPIINYKFAEEQIGCSKGDMLIEIEHGSFHYSNFYAYKNVFLEYKKEDSFHYSNYHLVSTTSIVHEIYEGEFKKCLNDKEETEVFSKPFKIKLIYGKAKGKDTLLGYELLEGDITEEEVKKLIETM
jgi:hypothetical protein